MVVNTITGHYLGRIIYYPPWGQHTFSAHDLNSSYTAGTLKAIDEFLAKLDKDKTDAEK